MNLDELESLLAVVEHGSIQAAAGALRISRATLRRRLAGLEAQVGVSLLIHGRKGASPTAAGRLLAGRGRAIVQEAHALRAAARERSRVPAGLLRVIAPIGLPPVALTLLASIARAQLPALHIRLGFHEDPAAGPLDDVDLAFHFGPRPPQGPWITTVLLRLPERAIATRDYLDRRGHPASLDDLDAHDLYSWRPPGEDGIRWPTADGERVVRPVLVSPDVHLIRQCALSGLGIALVPDAGLPDPGFDPDELVAVLPGLIGRECVFRLLIPEALADAPRIRAVLAVVRAYVETL